MSKKAMVANKVLTVVFLRREGEILLGYKKRGFGVGRWNGFGGKVEPGETIEQGARRELEEECGAVAPSLDKLGVLMFEFKDDPQLMEVHVFTTTSFTGEIVETEEMRPQWYSLAEIPFPQMWPDDLLWFPLMLEGRKFYGYFKFDGMDTIIGTHLEPVKCLEDIVIPAAPLVEL